MSSDKDTLFSFVFCGICNMQVDFIQVNTQFELLRGGETSSTRNDNVQRFSYLLLSFSKTG